MSPIGRLPIGTSFSLSGMPEIKGTLMSCSDCSAVVKVQKGARLVQIKDHQFMAMQTSHETWSTATLVDPIEG